MTVIKKVIQILRYYRTEVYIAGAMSSCNCLLRCIESVHFANEPAARRTNPTLRSLNIEPQCRALFFAHVLFTQNRLTQNYCISSMPVKQPKQMFHAILELSKRIRFPFRRLNISVLLIFSPYDREVLAMPLQHLPSAPQPLNCKTSCGADSTCDSP